MTVTDPPRLATWLLQRFSWGPRGESLVGDLLEQYQQKRSSVWYWRQVVTAMVASTTSEVAAHKLLAVRAVAVGALASVLFSVPVHWLGEIARASINDWIVASGHYSFWPVFLSGPVSITAFECVAGVAIGAIVARLHQAHAAAMVCLVSVSILLFEAGLVTLLLLSTQPHLPMPQAALVFPPLLAMGKPLSVLIGGLLCARSGQDPLSAISQPSRE
jgi:hypothetical protein